MKRYLFIELASLLILINIQAFSQGNPSTGPIEYAPAMSCGASSGVFNGNFQQINGCNLSPLNVTGNAQFQSGCVSGNWFVSHGTPEVTRSGVLIPNTAVSNNFAMMWSGNGHAFTGPNTNNIKGEGLFYSCTLLKGRLYRLKVKLGTYGAEKLDKVYIYMANGLKAKTSISQDVNDGSFVIPTVSDKSLLKDFTSFSNDILSKGFIETTIDFYPDKDYSSIYIYPEDSGDHDVLYMDDVNITSCLDYKEYSAVSLTGALPGITSVNTFIKASNATSVQSSERVTFQAGSYILLNPGFNVLPGGVFTATIQSCYEQYYCCSITPPTRISTNSGVTSIYNQKDDVKFEVYPNPTTNLITLQVQPKLEALEVQIYNSSGGKLPSSLIKRLDTKRYQVSLKNYPPGSYILKITTGNEVFSRTIIKE